MEKQYISYEYFGLLCDQLVAILKRDPRKISGVYGLPRGGLPIAVHISHHLDVPLIPHVSWGLQVYEDYILVVDDISDTGAALKNTQWLLRNKKMISATLFYKNMSTFLPDYYLYKTSDWVVFPWETDISKPSKYHQKIYPELYKCDTVLSGNATPEMLDDCHKVWREEKESIVGRDASSDMLDHCLEYQKDTENNDPGICEFLDSFNGGNSIE